MADNDPAQGRLAELRERWEADRSSRIFLQLAEEYRRVGRTHEALAVLREGLEQHPNHLSAQVAMGRNFLDLGEPVQATTTFEEIVAKDPTHLVANKLLIEARLRCDDAEGAADRLAHYRQLNSGDPEIPDLEGRIHALLEQAAAVPEPDPVPRAASEPSPFGEIFADPDRRRYLRSLDEGGLFPVPKEYYEEPPPPAPAAAFSQVPEADSAPPEMAAVAVHGGDPVAESPPETDPAATATLGSLYLEQGHHREAGEIFEEVLRQEPESPRAREGLDRVEALGDPPLQATDFLVGTEDSEDPPRVSLLKAYLDRIRRRSKRHVS
ncbi:MAG: tetratricopeptide repeat protein [Acidobacteriota bacterium]